MPSDPRTPDEIERDIERERAELASTVDALQDKISPEAVIRSIADGFRSHGNEIGHAVSQSVKQNPMALALTGVGLAWLVFGRSFDPLSARGESRSRPVFRNDDDYDDPDLRDYAGVDRDHAVTPGYRYSGGYESNRYRAGSRGRIPDWARHDLDDYDDYDDAWAEDDGGSVGERASSAVSGAASGIGGAAAGAASGARSAAGSVASGAKSAAGTIGDAAASAAGTARDAGRRTAERARRARERLARGTENLSEAARERVMNARARAVAMSQRASAAARRHYETGRDATQDFVEEQPLVAGALALAVGAALAGALPRTRREDELLGEMRDDLFDEAERILREERRKAERVAGAAMDEASKIVEEKRKAADDSAPGEKSAAEAAADEIRESGERLKEATRNAAEREKLGNPNG